MVEKEAKKPIDREPRNLEELAEISEKQKEILRSKLEEAEKHHHERQSEQEALEEAADLAAEADESKDDSRQATPAERRRGAPSKKQLDVSFNAQMRNIQAELSPGSRLISKIIHFKPVEKASDTISSTIARPNAMLYGSITAFVAVTALYFVARYYGYKLSGFETIAAFSAGWVLGVILEYMNVVFRGRKR